MNELVERDPPGAGGELALEYDAAGNMTNQMREKLGGGTETVEYTWDAWNRLVRVVIDTELRSETEYNGLTHRTIQRADTTGNGTLDQERRFTYDASWRIAEELVGPAGSSPARRVQHIWGNRYIDDLILRRIDDDYDGDYDADWYHLTDVQFSTVAVIEPRTSQNARVHERVTYDAYGRARHHWGHDVNGDGAITTSGGTSDLDIIQDIITAGDATISGENYRAEADLNRDGLIGFSDVLLVGSAKTALTRGALSDRTSTGPDSIIGWCGYVFIPETQFYHVRFRVYDTGLGRWKSPDPLGYVDGMGVYEYVIGNPIQWNDSDGLYATASDDRSNVCSRIQELYDRGELDHDRYLAARSNFDCDGVGILRRVGRWFRDRFIDVCAQPYGFLDCVGDCIADHKSIWNQLADGIAIAMNVPPQVSCGKYIPRPKRFWNRLPLHVKGSPDRKDPRIWRNPRFISDKGYTTSWRSLYQRLPIKSLRLNLIFKWIGRATMVVTLAEGAWMAAIEAHCTGHCLGMPRGQRYKSNAELQQLIDDLKESASFSCIGDEDGDRME